MLKHNYTLAALALAGLVSMPNAMAGVLPAYNQNFDAATSVPAEFGSLSLSSQLILGDGALTFQNNTNGRMFYCYWGPDAYEYAESLDSGTDNYYFSMDLTIAAGNDANAAQRNHNFVVVSESDVSVLTANANATWNMTARPNWLFSLAEIPNYTADSSLVVTSPFLYAVNGDTTKTASLSSTDVYTLTLNIDTIARTVKYSMLNKSTNIADLEGTYTVPEGVNMRPTGFFGLAARYNGSFKMDNILCGKQVSYDVPYAPTVVWSTIFDPVDGTDRSYDIYFNEGEKLYFKATDGAEIGYIDDSNYTKEGDGVYSISYGQIELEENAVTMVSSGKLVCWTQIGDVKSQEVEVEVVCEEIKLNTPTVTITGVTEGYGKTYTITTDNSVVPTGVYPGFQYEYLDKDGKVIQESAGVDQTNGLSLTFEEEGTLRVWSVMKGYTQSDVSTTENDVAYEIIYEIDFEHMTAEQVQELGFTTVIDPIQSEATSGENNWTARGRLYDWIVGDLNADGIQDTTTYYLPAGVTTIADNVIPRYQWPTTLDQMTEEQAKGIFPYFYVPYAMSKAQTLQISIGVGLLNASTAQSNSTYGFMDMQEGQFALVYKYTGYGTDAQHFYVGSVEEAMAKRHGVLAHVLPANSTFDLYRIDNAITLIQIMSPKGTPIENVQMDRVDDPNAPIYNLQGIMMGNDRNSLPRGLYIQNGKKFLVK